MKTLSKSLTLFSMLLMLFACGGGGGSLERETSSGNTGGDTGTTTDPTYTVTLSLTDQAGETDRDLSSENPLTLTATVVDQDGAALADALVTFSLSNENLASFSNDTGTARTDDAGVATINLTASTASGDGQITATTPDGTTGTTTFSATGTGATSDNYTVALSLANAGGEADRDLSSENPLTLNFTAVNASGNPLTDALITFTLSNDDIAQFSNDTGTARTNDSGEATIGLLVGSSAGDGQVTATLPDGSTQTTTFSSAGASVVTEVPAEMEFYASSVLLPSSGSDSVELIALVKNSQSVLMEGVEVSFSAPASAGVEIQQVDDATLENGTASALLSTSNNAGNRFVTVTATAGDVVRTIEIEIDGTEVTINGSRSITINDSATLTLRVQDSDGTNIPNQSISLSTDIGTLSATEVTTGTNGQASVTYTGSESGTATISGAALGSTTTFTITVQEDDFAFTTVPTEEVPVAPDDAYEAGDYTTLTVSWSKDNAVFAGGNVTFTASRGDIRPGDETGTTDASGEISFDIASTNAGVAEITATGNDGAGNEVTATVEIEFIATDAHIMYVDASPDIIGPDGQTSTISAVVRDPAGNLVKNKVVSFNVNDTSTGTISPSQATTDSNGIASTVFTSAAVTSEEFVLITATVIDEPEVTAQVSMTVGNRAFDVSIGTGNLIQSPDDTTYLKEFAVFVADSAGRPIEGVSLTASIAPVPFVEGGNYYRGTWVWVEPRWIVGILDENDEVSAGYTSICANEDINDNGMLDYEEDANEDSFLTPGIVGTVSFEGGIDETDANGQATLQLRYPRAYGQFYEANITVFAQSTGSESKASMYYKYGVASDDLTNLDVPPPSSPFGTSLPDDPNDRFTRIVFCGAN
ncbi:Ig-like domain-containing protein [Alteromonas confluentis]|uniref:Invasin n=1 Tax=Alteromonas confluentis TaxID=1656094 RepID=A0A1E7ZGQ5_9ALTE|nr:Ig-like domain-containing protein [Alteromonas confluentis]OFC72622.1 invasin [Alteromonas confluentis]